jgi:hypothetical protein
VGTGAAEARLHLVCNQQPALAADNVRRPFQEPVGKVGKALVGEERIDDQRRKAEGTGFERGDCLFELRRPGLGEGFTGSPPNGR